MAVRAITLGAGAVLGKHAGNFRTGAMGEEDSAQQICQLLKGNGPGRLIGRIGAHLELLFMAVDRER